MVKEKMESDIELPRGSYHVFTVIVNGFLSAGGDKKSVSTAEIASYIGRHHSLVGQNIKAITAFGIAKRFRGYKYKLTSIGADLAYSLEYKDEEGASSAYRRIISECEFLKSIVFAVKSRSGYLESDLRNYIAKLAKVKKKDPRATRGSQTVIDILVKSDFVVKEGEHILPTDKIYDLFKEGEVVDEIYIPDIKDSDIEEREVKRRIKPHVVRSSPMEMSIRLNFNIPFESTEYDLESVVKSIQYIQKRIMEEEKDEVE